MDTEFVSMRIAKPDVAHAIINGEKQLVIDDIYTLNDRFKPGKKIFVALGGDKGVKDVDWETGFYALVHVTNSPYGYYNEKYFKFDVEVDWIIPKAMPREAFNNYPDSNAAPFIGLETKRDPTQAVATLSYKKATAIIRAVIDKFPDEEDKIEKIMGKTFMDDVRSPIKYNVSISRAYKESVETSMKKFVRESENPSIMLPDCDQFTTEAFVSHFHNSFSLRFINSLLAKPFVILTGNSGTGKTRIARQFSKYLETELENGEKNWLIVPVGADWTDNIKVLGFYNHLADNGKGKYEKTKILELIERANQNPGIPFFLVLDEMNLSHVERYFSDFLSHMERKDSIFELDGYEGKLSYPDNLFVVGTVNIDETTYMFSPKVLDRANVIEFKPDKKDVMNLFNAEPGKAEIEPAGAGVAAAFLKLSREIRNGKSDVLNDPSVVASDKVTEIFSKLYDITEKQGFEFAFRTVREIKQYISAAYELQEDKSRFELDKTIDEQIVQKILPKIHGNKKEIGELFAELKALCPEDKMPLSFNKIDQMERKLSTVQYASFI